MESLFINENRNDSLPFQDDENKENILNQIFSCKTILKIGFIIFLILIISHKKDNTKEETYENNIFNKHINNKNNNTDKNKTKEKEDIPDNDSDKPEYKKEDINSDNPIEHSDTTSDSSFLIQLLI